MSSLKLASEMLDYHLTLTLLFIHPGSWMTNYDYSRKLRMNFSVELHPKMNSMLSSTSSVMTTVIYSPHLPDPIHVTDCSIMGAYFTPNTLLRSRHPFSKYTINACKGYIKSLLSTSLQDTKIKEELEYLADIFINRRHISSNNTYTLSSSNLYIINAAYGVIDGDLLLDER